MNARRSVVLLLALFAVSRVTAQSFTNPPVLAYRLLEGSTLTDDCPICGRPSLIRPLRGTFTLVQTNVNPIAAQYELRDIDFYTGSRSNAQHRIRGTGMYQVGGHLVVQQDMVLDVEVNDTPHVFTNESRSVTRQFPLIEISLVQTQESLFQVYSMHLVATPLREVWFSMTNQDSRTLVSSEGHVVKTISQLTAEFGFPPVGQPPLSDALDMAPGGEILFSLVQRTFSPRVGDIYEGDLLSNRGYVVRRNQQLTERMGFMPVVPDLGLDGVMMRDDGEILFSIRTNWFSERLGPVRRGDLLSDRGEIVMTNERLLERFSPTVAQDYGLDALHVWAHGEVWFSTEVDFQDSNLGLVHAGDLLSNQGIIVYRNAELTTPFNPAGQTNDFGLDSLFVITDFIQPAAPPQFTNIFRSSGTVLPCVRFEWRGPGRVFQVYQANEIDGPFEPSPMQPDTFFQVCPPAERRAFYYLRQW
jgi:hypothetical protein